LGLADVNTGFGRVNGELVLTKNNFSNVGSGSLKILDTEFHHVAVTKSGSTVVFYYRQAKSRRFTRPAVPPKPPTRFKAISSA
jgi:hypothetical protein